MCGGMEIEFRSLRLFFFFTLTIYRTASASNNTQFRIDPQSIDDRGRVASYVVNNNIYIYCYDDEHLHSRVRNSVMALEKRHFRIVSVVRKCF